MNAALPIHIVPATEIPVVWPYVEPGIRAVLVAVGDGYTSEDTLKALLGGDVFLMLFAAHGSEVGVVFDFYDDPARGKGARVRMVFGRGMEQLAEEFALAEQWAKTQGCNFIEAHARSYSRARLFSRFGYKLEYVTVTKELQ